MSLIIIMSCLFALTECSSAEDVNGTATISKSLSSASLSTDKACYKPGEQVYFTTKILPNSAYVKYYHLGKVVEEQPLSSANWSWTPPSKDYLGYLAEIFTKQKDGTECILGSIAVDVSSDWKCFPRYGFLSNFDDLTSEKIESIVSNLNRYHLNGVQFQDWHYKHHMPLAGSRNNPDQHWTDIAKRNTSLNTIRGYISALHQYNIKAMFYNLCYGALSDAASDGVQDDWYLFKDKNHLQKDCLNLPSPMFKSVINILDSGNSDWQNYLAERNDDVYHVFDFDGYQIDQLGSQGNVYNYEGDVVDLPSGFASFIKAMKMKQPNKHLVMNSVSRFGAKQIAETADVDFLYNEVWSEDADYSSLKSIIDENNSYNDSLKTVFAAYMNYDKAENKGYFNTPGVILADAVMFSLGGSHLEIGEHMLGKEYFPNSNLQMDVSLQSAIISYYDFLTAYQNLLRNGGTFNSVDVSCINGKMSLSAWPPSMGSVTVLAKKADDKTQVLHLINLSRADCLSWRDLNGTMPEPSLIYTPIINLKESRTVKRIWMASPDIDFGVCKDLTFDQNQSEISFSLPSLKYWDMVVIEYN